MYVYKATHPKSDQPPLFEVGFYSPHGIWHPESEYQTAGEAAERVHWLNGGCDRKDD